MLQWSNKNSNIVCNRKTMRFLYYFFLFLILCLDILFPFIFGRNGSNATSFFLLQTLNSVCAPVLSLLYANKMKEIMPQGTIRTYCRYCLSHHINIWVGVFVPFLSFFLLSPGIIRGFDGMDIISMVLLELCLVIVFLGIVGSIRYYGRYAWVYVECLLLLVTLSVALTKSVQFLNVLSFTLVLLIITLCYMAVMNRLKKKGKLIQ